MRVLRRSKIVVALAALVIGGCHPGERPPAGPGVGPETMISVQQLAGLLGMRVSEIASTHVTLKDATNTVLIFTTSNGMVYVNAGPVCEVGRVETIAGRLHVRQSLVSQISTALEKPKPPSYKPPARPSGSVVIDAGHGGHDPGAVSVLGFYEKTVNLEVARKAAYLLRQKGMKVVMTREADSFIQLEARAQTANAYSPQLFVSLHANSTSRSTVRGFTIYVARGASWAARRAARSIAGAMDRTGIENLGVQEADYRVLVQTRCPAVLVEMGYISNSQEARLLRDPSFQSRMGGAIAEGITSFLSGGIP